MAPLTDSQFCWAHDAEHQEEAAAARRAGGQVKKKQGTLALAYDLNGLETVADIRRWIEVAMYETLSLENTVSRNRAILSGALGATKLRETGELEERVEALEAVLTREGEVAEVFAEPAKRKENEQAPETDDE
jgi:hypothetical protein